MNLAQTVEELEKKPVSTKWAIECTYRGLLSIPLDDPSRLRLQGALAALRDEIALITGRTPEDVQTSYESRR